MSAVIVLSTLLLLQAKSAAIPAYVVKFRIYEIKRGVAALPGISNSNEPNSSTLYRLQSAKLEAALQKLQKASKIELLYDSSLFAGMGHLTTSETTDTKDRLGYKFCVTPGARKGKTAYWRWQFIARHAGQELSNWGSEKGKPSPIGLKETMAVHNTPSKGHPGFFACWSLEPQ